MLVAAVIVVGLVHQQRQQQLLRRQDLPCRGWCVGVCALLGMGRWGRLRRKTLGRRGRWAAGMGYGEMTCGGGGLSRMSTTVSSDEDADGMGWLSVLIRNR